MLGFWHSPCLQQYSHFCVSLISFFHSTELIAAVRFLIFCMERKSVIPELIPKEDYDYLHNPFFIVRKHDFQIIK